MQNIDTFCKAMMKLIEEKKLSSFEKYLVYNEKLLHKVVTEDDKSFSCTSSILSSY